MSDVDASSTLLHPASGALILGLDWILFSQNAMSLGLSTLLVAVVGFGGAGLGTGLLQYRYARDGLAVALIKGLLAGIAVGIPFPVAGTVVGGGILTLSGLNTFWRSPSSDRIPPSREDTP